MEDRKHIEAAVNSYLQGNCTAAELELALNIFEDSRYHFILHNLLSEYWNEKLIHNSLSLDNEDKLSIIFRIHQKIHKDNERKLLLKSGKNKILLLARIVAILLIGLFAGIFLVRYANYNHQEFTSITPSGSISQFILPDETVVYLNSGSRLTFTNNFRKKNIRLEGEAWFDVNKNDKVPFIIETTDYSVHVTGTKFNVKAYETDKDVVTTLEEGQIKIYPQHGNVKDVKVLMPGQQLIFNKTTNTYRLKPSVNTKIYSSWKENKLIFINMNLKELFKLLERKYGVNILVRNDDILNHHYDGTIKNESIIEVLNLVKETIPIRYKIEGQNIIITKKDNPL